MGLCFAAENTLGRLAKWLRILGFDTVYERELPAGDFNGSGPDRIILTRRTPHYQRRPCNPYVVIRSDHYMNQLAEVIQATGIAPGFIRPFSRCIRCNTAIQPADKKYLRGKVPDYVWETHDTFRFCNACQRIYWSGSHIEHSLEKISRLFRDA